jgi:short-subunit dehydrogenase
LLELTAERIYKDVQKNGSRRIGLVVCNAMYTAGGSFLDVAVEKQKKVVALNNENLLELVHPLAKAMRDDGRGGGVILM